MEHTYYGTRNEGIWIKEGKIYKIRYKNESDKDVIMSRKTANKEKFFDKLKELMTALAKKYPDWFIETYNELKPNTAEKQIAREVYDTCIGEAKNEQTLVIKLGKKQPKEIQEIVKAWRLTEKKAKKT